MKYWKWAAGAIVVWGMFAWLGMVRLDPDFGWHVRLGNLILQQGIPKTDPFSYTMANLPFVDHEWLSNVLMAVGYRVIGKTGMSMAAALVALAAIAVAVPGKWRKWMAAPAILAITIFWPRSGIRPQIEDWVWLPLIVRLTGEEEKWKKWKWGLVPIMLIWANMHGGFVIGIAVTATVLAVRSWEEKRWRWGDWAVWGTATLVTLVNPYGIRLWGEVWQQVTDREVGKIIAEWQPFWADVELGWLLLVALAGVLIWRFRRVLPKWKMAVVVGTWAASMSSLRNGALFAVVTAPVVAELLGRFYEQMRGDKVAAGRTLKFYKGLVMLSAGLLALEVGLTVVNPQTLGGESFFYPVKAVAWLNENGVKGNFFTEYAWGGYLDWKFPQTKIFIDGRMATWKWKSPDPKYSDYVFGEYEDIAYKGKGKKWFDKYDIKTALLMKSKTWPLREWLKSTLNRMGIDFTPDKGVTLAEQLAGQGWTRVYEDDTAVIYEKL